MNTMTDNDYLTTYRRFFEQYVNTVDSNDPLPLRVASYSLREEELLGQIVDCCVQYLYFINCPLSLQTYLSKLAIDEVYGSYRANPLSCYEPLKIMQTATKTIAEICRRHLDNETVSKIPPPEDGPLVSALGIKHTRRKMEDRMVCIPQLHILYNVQAAHSAAYYAIFDGHGGPDAATYAVSHFHQFMVESSHYPQDVEKAMRESYAKTDNLFISKRNRGGSTGLVVLHEPELKKLTVSWLGDSQAMLIRAGQPIMLVNPHRPGRPDEVQRIHESGGFVTELDGIFRVNGELAVSRAFGNSQYKPIVSAEPDVITVPLDGTEEAFILGCDGFWDVLDARKVHETFYFHVANQSDCGDLSRRLVNLAKEFDSTDNITVIAVLLKPGSELIAPSVSATMETQELEPFRGNGSLIAGPKHDDDDFGPETDVDAPDEANPFGWSRPDPLQTFSDLSGLKANPGVRFNNEYVGVDNPFSNNLHDIAEEKSTEDMKAEKEIFNNNEFIAKSFGNELFGVEFDQTNGIEKKLNDDDDSFILEKSDATEVTQGLPDVVSIPDTTDVIADEKVAFENTFERDICEVEQAGKVEIAGKETINPFDRATPELSATVVVQNNAFDEDEKPVELETLKTMMLAEPVNEEENFATVDPIDTIRRDNEFDGRFAADDVVETGPDGEESEEEWNYYQGDENRPPSSQLQNSDLDNMNSPLNPNAAEFVPVSPPSGLIETKTPIKAIPPGLLDDIASSPNWANMDAVEVPDVDTFLEGAKTRPSDVALDPTVQPFSMQEETERVDPQGGDLEGVHPLDDSIGSLIDTSQNLITEVNADKLIEQQSGSISASDLLEPQRPKEQPTLLDFEQQQAHEEPRGLDLATDMTSSFIDPATIGPDPEEFSPTVLPQYNGFRSINNDSNSTNQDSVVFQDLFSAKAELVSPVQLENNELLLSETVAPAQLDIQVQSAVIEEEQPLQLVDVLDIPKSAPVESPAEIQEVPQMSRRNSTPLVAYDELLAAPVVADPQLEAIADNLTPTVAVAAAAGAAAAAAAGAAAAATVAVTKKSQTKTAPASKPTPRSPATPKTTAAKVAPAKKPATPTSARTAVAPKPAVPKTTSASPAAAARPAPSKPKTVVAAPKPKPIATKIEPKPTVTAATRLSTAAAPKPAVKSTIPPRPATTARPRVPSAPTNGVANGDVKTAKKPVEPIVKKTASVQARVPLTARPATAPVRPATAVKTTTTATKPLTARPSSAKPAAAAAAAKPATTVKKTIPAAKTNGVTKPGPTKRAVPAAKAEIKTEVKTADKAPGVVSNGVN